jgi:hypothetical protein
LLGARGVAFSVRKYQGKTYLFAVRMAESVAKGTFRVKGLAGETPVRVIGEDRALAARDGRFEDDFGPYAVHLYEMDGARD